MTTNTDPVRKAIRKARNIADGAGAHPSRGHLHAGGMRRACNIIEAALASAPPSVPDGLIPVRWEARRRNRYNGEWGDWINVNPTTEADVKAESVASEWDFRTLYALAQQPPSAPVGVEADLREALTQIARATEKLDTDGCEECYLAACIANGALARSAPSENTILSQQPAPPSAPVGVEGLMQLAREWCLSWGEWAHDADPGCAKESAAEAALRAALTQALARQPAACPKCDGTGEADSGGIMPWGAPATIPCDCQQPSAPVGVAYLDIGAGGYMDLGSELSDEELAKLPYGRHVLGIIGTHGVDGYVLAQQPAAPSGAAASAEPAAWVAADTLGSPHPRYISSLAYMSWQDRERGREYVPLYAAPQHRQA